ncbi:MAG: hypothetical protein IPH16_18605 [Haliscomenobacter sp.]|nr:hypothetical protein [Haliscomenobacter sp.]
MRRYRRRRSAHFAPVTADFTIAGDTCSAQPFQFVNRTDTGGQPGEKLFLELWRRISSSASASDPSYQYTKAGTWTIGLKVTTVDGCTGQIEKPLNVYPCLPVYLSKPPFRPAVPRR